MAGDWIKIRTGITQKIQFLKIRNATGLSDAECLEKLYLLASWFRTHGKYGVMRGLSLSTVDFYIGVDGFCDALIQVDWMRAENGSVVLRGYTDVSSIRKSLGKQVRSKVLANACCVACGSVDDLHVDHKVPVSRGGTSELENLQALCASCNIKKGRKTMEEWNV